MKIAGIGICTRSPDATSRGLARWRALAGAALDELGGRRDVPILIGSCNGAVDEPDAASWSRAFAVLGELPVASAACASGLHALWLAATRLADDCDEVIVLAVDTRSRASHANFEALRVLDDEPAPWQPTSPGFKEGEAAVALRLVRGDGLSAPLLGDDNLDELVRAIGGDVDFIVGQGTGPVAVDEKELAALPANVPLATALANVGHTIGASGLLSVALAARVMPSESRTGSGSYVHDVRASADAEHALSPSHLDAMDGRPLGLPARRERALVVCRALGGATAVVRLERPTVDPRSDAERPCASGFGSGFGDERRVASAVAVLRQPSRWIAPQHPPKQPPPLRLPLLRRIATLPRPDAVPAVLVVRLDAPLVPPDDARIGGKLLPSVVLEITPGFISQLLARAWGFAGPALTLVGGSDAGWLPTLAAIRRVHGPVLVLHVHAGDFEWGK